MEFVELKQSSTKFITIDDSVKIYYRDPVCLVILSTTEKINDEKPRFNSRNYIFKSEYVRKNIREKDFKSWIFNSKEDNDLYIVKQSYLNNYKEGIINHENNFYTQNEIKFDLNIFENSPLENFVFDNTYNPYFLMKFDGKVIHRKIKIGHIFSNTGSNKYDLNKVKEILSLDPKISNINIIDIPYRERNHPDANQEIEFVYDPDQKQFETILLVGEFDFINILMSELKSKLGLAEK